jgi:uncharacterized protein
MIFVYNQTQRGIIEASEAYAKKTLAHDASGHDYQHIERVRKMALGIAEEEGGNQYTIELASILHDVADPKINSGVHTHEDAGRLVRQWLSQVGCGNDTSTHVGAIIASMSFKGAGVTTPMMTVEGKIVQDADRLDAIGAIGIARCFAYGGSKGRAIYDPAIKPVLHASAAAYGTSRSTSVNHFHEKLLLLEQRMNTETAKRIAKSRTSFMKDYLQRLKNELEGKG